VGKIPLERKFDGTKMLSEFFFRFGKISNYVC
jgi:hypothetical protein